MPTQGTPNKEPIVSIPDFLGGLFTDADPARIPENCLTIADHIEYFRGMPFRRNGITSWPVAKPDSNQIQGIFTFFEVTTGLNILRFTKNKIYKSTSSGWIEFTPSGIAAMGGGSLDYFSFGVIDNRMFFTNNGVDPIREIDPVTQTYKALGNAPQYRYICPAFNRIIGVNRVDAVDVPFQVGWCGESNYTEWNPLVDISAGRQNLTSSTTNYADDVSGIFTIGELLIVPRLNSIWLGQHTPSATSPFAFFSAPGLSSIGADLPRTIKLTDYGLVWVCNNTSTVYVYQPSPYQQALEQIELSQKIRRQLRAALNSALQVWAAYSHETRIYTIYISYSSGSVSAFSYNFITKTWTTSSYSPQLTETTSIDYGAAAITINDLTGSINSLQGSIDSLGGLDQNNSRIFGFSNGDIGVQPPYSGLPQENVNKIYLEDFNGGVFATILALKVLEIAPYNANNTLIRFGLYPYTAGTIVLQYSKNDGGTWVTAKTVVFDGLSPAQQYIQIKRSLKVRRIIWRIATEDCMFATSEFTIRQAEAGIA